MLSHSVQGIEFMLDRRTPGANFGGTPCPICDGMFPKCGLPNHVRLHINYAARRSGSTTNGSVIAGLSSSN
jgi:hypothetical protein